MEYELIIIRYGEIALKSKTTRKHFESRLITNIKNAFKRKKITCNIKKDWGRIYVYTDLIHESILILKNIFGIVSVSPAIRTESNMDSISELALKISEVFLTKEKSFAIRAARTGEHAFTSQDVAVKIGNDVVEATKAGVNLTKPDFELFIEVRDENAYIFTEKIRGTGGMPLGTQGKAIAFIGTPKSILAAWLIMKRGCTTYFAVNNTDMKKMLENFMPKWNIPHPHVIFLKTSQDDKICGQLKDIAIQGKCDAFVTGETVYDKKHLHLPTDKETGYYPILRPLIAFDEKEVNRRCRKLGIKT
ncbi:thiamine biosynthesis ATP pyrophosphatase [Thermoplasmatales archaeon SCGC AB-539-N05]|nr:thiamine biosynthesis ATP pyrophosphatase [Thermoplasmatales archaeon SCGC AB-539-N05]